MTVRPSSIPAVPTPRPIGRRLDHEDAGGVARADIHDIRVLTATGPIDLPRSSSGGREHRKA